MANVHKKVTIKAAVKHFGRKGDGYGGKAALARALDISQNAINQWRTPWVPARHLAKLMPHLQGKQ